MTYPQVSKAHKMRNSPNRLMNSKGKRRGSPNMLLRRNSPVQTMNENERVSGTELVKDSGSDMNANKSDDESLQNNYAGAKFSEPPPPTLLPRPPLHWMTSAVILHKNIDECITSQLKMLLKVEA